jgi:hypothetical protein
MALVSGNALTAKALKEGVDTVFYLIGGPITARFSCYGM